MSTNVGSIPKKGLVGNPGLGGLSSGPGRGEMVIPPVSGEQNTVEFQSLRCLALSRERLTCLPVSVHHCATLLPNHTVVPLPRLLVQRFTNYSNREVDL